MRASNAFVSVNPYSIALRRLPMKSFRLERSEEVMAVQQGISLENNETLVGQQLKVIVDRKEGKLWVGRSEYDSPEVDNEIWIEPNGLKIIPGSFVDVRITAASDYDLNAIALPAS